MSMSDSPTTKLLAEYGANVELWKHDDSLRQQRSSNFLSVNTVLLVAVGAVTSLGPSLEYVAAAALPIAIFGILVCVIWRAVHVRNAEYIRFRRVQLRSIEERLVEMKTFTNTYRAFDQHERIEFPRIDDFFEIAPNARRRSTVSENVLPLLLIGFWVVVLVVAVTVVIIALADGQFG